VVLRQKDVGRKICLPDGVEGRVANAAHVRQQSSLPTLGIQLQGPDLVCDAGARREDILPVKSVDDTSFTRRQKPSSRHRYIMHTKKKRTEKIRNREESCLLFKQIPLEYETTPCSSIAHLADVRAQLAVDPAAFQAHHDAQINRGPLWSSALAV
jgi:hypothetical protein